MLLQHDDAPAHLPIGKRAHTWRDYDWVSSIAQWAIHIGALAGLFIGASPTVWLLCAVLYVVRMFVVTAFHHRYFSHRSFKTSRIAQFVMALLAQTCSQRGVLWWAAHHRNHHKYSDTAHDVHSPRQFGFWHSHILWIYDGNMKTDYTRVRDLARYPELVVLDKLWWIPPALLAVGCYLAAGLPGLLVGYMLSTVLSWHASFSINSLAHVWGSRRYATHDDSRNNFWLALLTLGEGWHNNHHHYMNSARQGFFWWEIDITYYLLKMMSWVGIVWDLKEPPAKVLMSTQKSH